MFEKKLWRRSAVALVALSLALAGCGGDDEEDQAGTQETPAATQTETAAATTDTTATGTGTGGAAAPSTVKLAADPGGQLEFEQATLEAKAGKVAIELTNESTVPHNVAIEKDDQTLATSDTVTAGETTLEVDLEAGDYTFYCSIDGHRQAGMEGKLTVR